MQYGALIWGRDTIGSSRATTWESGQNNVSWVNVLGQRLVFSLIIQNQDLRTGTAIADYRVPLSGHSTSARWYFSVVGAYEFVFIRFARDENWRRNYCRFTKRKNSISSRNRSLRQLQRRQHEWCLSVETYTSYSTDGTCGVRPSELTQAAV